MKKSDLRPSPPEARSRREFFRAAADCAACTGAGFLLLLPMLSSRAGAQSNGGGDKPVTEPKWVDAGEVAKFPVDSVVKVERPEGAFFVTKRKNNTFFVLSAICSHESKYQVRWMEQQKVFLCLTHGALFDAEGEVKKGPAKRPLALLPVRVQNNKVQVQIGGVVPRPARKPAAAGAPS